MIRKDRVRSTIILGAALTCVLAVASDALAQAWVPAKGEGAVAVALTNIKVQDHILTKTWVDIGQIDTFVLVTDVTYGLTDRIAVDLALPFVSSKYTGTRPHPTALDDGNYHHSFADFRFSLRYNLTRGGGAVLTPYIGTVVPSNNYEFFAHSAPGEQLNELQVGAYVAKLFDRGIPGTFVSGRVAYGFVEEVLDVSHNRTMADLEVGYFFTPSFRAFVMGNAQYTHGGIDIPLAGLAALAPQFRPVHDQIDRAHHLNLGAGAAYSVTDSVDVFGSFVRTVMGRNEHAVNRGVTIGASWGFARKSKSPDTITALPPAADTTVADKRQGSLVRCICQKSGS
jgi:hypothetical protein